MKILFFIALVVTSINTYQSHVLNNESAFWGWLCASSWILVVIIKDFTNERKH